MSKKRREIPDFGTPIIETHCHLDYLKQDSLDQLLERCESVGIERIITIAVSPDNLETVRELTQHHEMIYGTQGIHPHDAEKFTSDTEDEIRECIGQDNILAVGEIGLDYYYEHAPKKVQRQAFEAQLQIAVDTEKPVVIHSREADDDTKAILSNFSSTLKKRGVIHSFTAGIELANYCLDEGFCLGFNGICTFNKAENVREIIRQTPLAQILLETDAPYLTPVPYRGEENAPYYLPFIAEKVAEVKEVSIETILEQAYQNSINTFF
ncbi:MAG: TatD family hydrolase [Gammaproteobacteria bacterium]|nr:TatD family hydrolase [Gammaproteobacteria bacterium]